MTEVLSGRVDLQDEVVYVCPGTESCPFFWLPVLFFPELTAEVAVTLLGIIIIVLGPLSLALQSCVMTIYSSLLLIVGHTPDFLQE